MERVYAFKPVQFFAATLCLTWFSLFFAAYCSHFEALRLYQLAAMLISILCPFGVALFLIFRSKNKGLKIDFESRVFLFKTIRLKAWLFIIFTIPIAVLLATAISLLFGQPASQFLLAREFAVMNGNAAVSITILFLAPAMEEMGWREYGVDSLAGGRNLFQLSLLFAFLWSLWQVPLFFIKGYYHYNLFQAAPLFALNFFVGLIPVSILQNWLYYKSGRSIPAIIIFHFLLNFFSSLFQTELATKCIVTTILIGASAVIVGKNKDFFFRRQDRFSLLPKGIVPVVPTRA
jgi:uncharacterized protein